MPTANPLKDQESLWATIPSNQAQDSQHILLAMVRKESLMYKLKFFSIIGVFAITQTSLAAVASDCPYRNKDSRHAITCAAPSKPATKGSEQVPSVRSHGKGTDGQASTKS